MGASSPNGDENKKSLKPPPSNREQFHPQKKMLSIFVYFGVQVRGQPSYEPQELSGPTCWWKKSETTTWDVYKTL